MIAPPKSHQPQAGEIMTLRGVGKVRVVYTGSRFCRVTDLGGSNSRLCDKRDLLPLPPPPAPEPVADSSIFSLDREFTTWSHK